MLIISPTPKFCHRETLVLVSAAYNSARVTPRVGGRATMVEGIVPRLTLIGPHVSIDLASVAFLIFLQGTFILNFILNSLSVIFSCQ